MNDGRADCCRSGNTDTGGGERLTSDNTEGVGLGEERCSGV